MTDLNRVTLLGNLTRDVGSDEKAFGYSSNGQARVNFSIAVNRSIKKGDEWVDEVNYFDITLWGKSAENLKPYLVKGQKVAIDGYLKQDRWEKDGEKKSRISIIANSVWLVGGRKEGSNNTNNNTGENTSFQTQEETTSYDGADIPF